MAAGGLCLGRMEDIAREYCVMRGTLEITAPKPAVAVFAFEYTDGWHDAFTVIDNGIDVGLELVWKLIGQHMAGTGEEGNEDRGR